MPPACCSVPLTWCSGRVACPTVVVWVPALGVAVAVIRHDGFYGLITYDTNLGAMITGSYAVIKFGRWRRRVAPKPRPEQADEEVERDPRRQG